MAEKLLVCSDSLKQITYLARLFGRDWAAKELGIDAMAHKVFPDVGVKTADLVEVDLTNFGERR